MVAFTKSIGGQRHGEVGLPRGAREAAADVPFLAGLLVLRVDADDAVRVDLEGDLDLDLARRSATQAGERDRGPADDPDDLYDDDLDQENEHA
mgnify:CR=1 FL=1